VISGHFFGKDAYAFSKLYYPFHTHCDGLITGLIVANLMVSRDRLGWLLKRPGLTVFASMVLMVVLNRIQNDIFDFTGLGVFFAAVVWWGIQSKPQWFSQHAFYLLSRLSFGMYLNHEYMGEFIVRHLEPALGLMKLGAVGASAAGFLILTLFSMCVSAVTFCLVEHPFLMVRTALLQKGDLHLTAH
jgi:hypothetical protein